MSHTIYEYRRAIRSNYSRSHNRAISIVYGLPHRELDYSSLSFNTKPNTRDGQIGNTYYEIEVDSPDQTRVQIIRHPSWFRLQYYRLRYRNNPAKLDSIAKDVATIYTNPSLEFIANSMPPDRFIYLKYLYVLFLSKLCKMTAITNISIMLYSQQQDPGDGIKLARARIDHYKRLYFEWTSSWHIKHRLRTLLECTITQHIPLLYVKDFEVIHRALKRRYGVNWAFTCLRGGWYPSDFCSFEETYTFSNGQLKYKFTQSTAYSKSKVISYYDATENAALPNTRKLTYYQLFKLISGLPIS